jgi:hypothetical protein
MYAPRCLHIALGTTPDKVCFRPAQAADAHAPTLILVAFSLLALLYCFSAPIFEKPDEDRHFSFARALAQGNGLPVQQPGVQTPWAQEGSQPPLYYALASLVVRAFDTSDYATQRQLNPAMVFNPDAIGNKNRLIITPEKRAFAYRDTTAAAVVLRLLGILPGLLAVWAVYHIALRVSASRPTALLAMAFTALNPMLLYITTSVSNDGLVIALSSLALLISVQLMLDNGLSQRAAFARVLALGALIALASMTKLSGAILLPIGLIAIAARALPQHAGKERLTAQSIMTMALQAGIVLALWLLVCGWWFARNYTLYGEFTGTMRMAQMAGLRQLSLLQVLNEFPGFRMSYLALFGMFNITAGEGIYTAFNVLVILGLLGLGYASVRVLRRLKLAGWTSPLALRACAAALLAAHVMVTLAGIVQWTMISPASQGRLLFPAIAGISTLLAIGLRQYDPLFAFLGTRLTSLVTPLVLGLSGLLALLAPIAYIAPAYAPPLISQVPADVLPVTQQFAPWAELVAYRMTPANARPGDDVRVTAILRALGTPGDDYSLVVKLYGRDNALLTRFDTIPGGGLLPSKQWRAGELWQDQIKLTIPADARAPAVLKAQFELYSPGSGAIITSTDGQGHPGAPLFDGATLLPPATARASSTLATFGDAGALNHLNVSPLRPNQPFTVTLQWQAFAPTPGNDSVFVHLLDASGQVVAQHDGPPDGGNFPTSHWGGLAVFDDAHTLAIPADLAPGHYTLVVGIYDPQTGERIDVRNARGEQQPDRAIALKTLTVE